MGLNVLKNVFIGFQIAGASLALIATIGNIIVSKKIEKFGPYYQKIKTANTTVEIFIESSEKTNSHFMDSGGYLAFGKGNDLILETSANDCVGKQLGNNEVLFRGTFNLDVNDPAFNKPVHILSKAEYVQITFYPMPKGSKVLRGKAICILNGSIELDISVPPQVSKVRNIFVPNIKDLFSNFPKTE